MKMALFDLWSRAAALAQMRRVVIESDPNYFKYVDIVDVIGSKLAIKLRYARHIGVFLLEVLFCLCLYSK